MSDYFTKGPGVTDESTTRTVPATDGVQKVEGKDADGASTTANPVQVGGSDASGNNEALLVKATGELDLPDVVNRLGSQTTPSTDSDTLHGTPSTSASLISLLKTWAAAIGSRASATADSDTVHATPATEVSFIAILKGQLTALGQRTATAATSDTGSFSLLALTKRLLSKLTTQLDLTLTAFRDAIRGGDDRTLTSLYDKLANDGDNITSAAFGSVQTAADGTSWTALASAACKQVPLYNDTGTTLLIRRGGAGTEFPHVDGTYITYRGLTNADQLEVKRQDESTTQVTAYYEIES